MKPRSSNLAVLLGILLGASVGGIIALILLRRFREGRRFRLTEVPWRELLGLIGPVVYLGRQLRAISRRAE